MNNACYGCVHYSEVPGVDGPFCWAHEKYINDTKMTPDWCQNRYESIKDPTSFWEQLKMMTYWIVRIPGMIFDKQRKE